MIVYDVNGDNRRVYRLSDAEFDAADDNNDDDDYDDDVGLELFPLSLTKLKWFFLIIVAILMKMTMLAVTVRMKIYNVSPIDIDKDIYFSLAFGFDNLIR